MNIPDKMFINGKWVDSRSAQRIPDVNPSTEEIITGRTQGKRGGYRFGSPGSPVGLRRRLERDHAGGTRAAYLPAGRSDPGSTRQELAELETMDVGKPLRDSLGDIQGVVETLRYNAGAADKLQGDTIPLGNQFVDFTWLEPLGVTAHIVPWNFPLGMAIRSIAPALAAGCTVVLKPAEKSPLSALKMAEIAQSVGFPDGVINVVTGLW